MISYLKCEKREKNYIMAIEYSQKGILIIRVYFQKKKKGSKLAVT